MAGRHRLPPHAGLHQHHPPPPLAHALTRGGPVPPPSILAALEERIASQHRDLQQLLGDNERLASTHIAFKQDLAASRHDLRLLADSAARAKADGDAAVGDLYERSLLAEEEARRVEAMRKELAIVRSDISRLGKDRDELMEKVEKLRVEAAKVRGETGKVEGVMWEIEFMRSEIERGRAAIEYEKKAHAENFEQSQTMQKNMISMAREVEKLRAELANAEKRARAAAAAAAKPGPAYAETYGKNEMAYGGSTYASTYGIHQAQGDADRSSQYGSQYGSGTVPRSPYDVQQTHVHRPLAIYSFVKGYFVVEHGLKIFPDHRRKSSSLSLASESGVKEVCGGTLLIVLSCCLDIWNMVSSCIFEQFWWVITGMFCQHCLHLINHGERCFGL